MKRVITTVGTSIFNNYFQEHDDIKDHYSYIENKRHREWDACKDRLNRVRKPLTDWARQNRDASAEIKSLIKLYEMEKDNLDVYLLATDTVVSRLAAEIIKDVFTGIEGINIAFNEKQDVISGLQVEDYEAFVKTGSHEFVRRIINIARGYFSDVVFNISGGYKGLIPFMTIMAQVNSCDVVYIYEESEALIKIPKTPIKIDYDLFAKYYQEIVLLDNAIENYEAVKKANYRIFNELEERGFVEILGNDAFLSPIGKIFFERYKNQFFVFYCTDEVWEEIQGQKDIKRILTDKFSKEEIRKNKTETKQELKDAKHKVYDDGDNNNRIYYFEEGGNIYIYKTFEDEEAAREFIKTKFDKEKVIKNSTLRKWRLNNV